MLDFSAVAENNKSKNPERRKMVMLTPAVPQIGPVQKEFDKYAPKLVELEKQAKALKVVDNETFQISIDGAGTAKGLVKAIDGRRAEITAPFREFINKVNNAAQFFTDPFKRIADEFSRKGGDYHYQLQLAEKKRQKAIDEANEALQEKLDKQAKEDGVEQVTVVPVKAPKPDTVIHTAGGHSQYLRKPWVGEIEDGAVLQEVVKALIECLKSKKIVLAKDLADQILNLTPYFIFDQKIINQAVKMGVRWIPGVKIFEKVSAVHR